MSGGMRVGAGRPQKSLEDKILDGDITKNEIKETGLSVENLKDESDLATEEVSSEVLIKGQPMTKEYMMQPQAGDITKLEAGNEIKDIYEWVFKMGCSQLVPTQLLEQYAMNRARWIQCQNAISSTGFIVKSPKSGRPIKNPFIEIMINVEKQMNNTFMIINQIVREHCIQGYKEYTPDDEFYKDLLD